MQQLTDEASTQDNSRETSLELSHCDTTVRPWHNTPQGRFRRCNLQRYGWTLPNLSVDCVCQKSAFTLQHALDCMIGGFRVIQHNEVRDVFAQLFRDAGHTVEVEPFQSHWILEGDATGV